VWLPRALEVSADRYGSIGVAFTYLAWLYVVSFCVLLTAVFGEVIAVDRGWLGRRISGPSRTAPPQTDPPQTDPHRTDPRAGAQVDRP
jgi:uncharacterized BrkB/YihY/UPF0761 family membrane protein